MNNFYHYYPRQTFLPTSPIINPSANRQMASERFLGGGFLAPFLLGGLAGAAIARPRPMWWGAPYWYCCW